MLSKEFIEEMKQKLIDAKNQLTQELGGLPVHTEMGDDLEAQEDEVEVDDVNHDIRERIESDLKKIETALTKIETGSYGIDDDGKEISEARLRAIPWADKAI